MDTLIECAGWAGAGAMLLGYLLLSTKRIPAGRTFQLFNVAGALGLALHGATNQAWPSVTLNLSWLLVGLATLRKYRQQAAGDAAAVAVASRRGRRPGNAQLRVIAGRWPLGGQSSPGDQGR